MEVRNAGSNCVSGNLGIVPLDREHDGRAADNAEIEGVVRVFPDVFGIHNEVSAERLLQTNMKFVTVAWVDRSQRQAQRRAAATRVARNGMLHPVLAMTRFSLNGVSMVRA